MGKRDPSKRKGQTRRNPGSSFSVLCTLGVLLFAFFFFPSDSLVPSLKRKSVDLPQRTLPESAVLPPALIPFSPNTLQARLRHNFFFLPLSLPPNSLGCCITLYIRGIVLFSHPKPFFTRSAPEACRRLLNQNFFSTPALSPSSSFLFLLPLGCHA
jgi:hypothetical protein